jgi:AAA family ATP:ADP antiporter
MSSDNKDNITATSPPMANRNPFQQFADKFWVIEKKETRKAYPLMMMMFLICFSYTLLRDLKDVMVLEIGKSELISYLKLFGTLPVSIVFMVAYTKLALNKSKAYIFYSMLGFFLGLFALIMAAYALYVSTFY